MASVVISGDIHGGVSLESSASNLQQANQIVVHAIQGWPIKGAIAGSAANIKQINEDVEYLANHMMIEINDKLKESQKPAIDAETVLKDYVDNKGRYHAAVKEWAYKTGLISGFKGLIETESKALKTLELKNNKERLRRKKINAVDPIVVDAIRGWTFKKTPKRKWMDPKKWEVRSREEAKKIMDDIHAKGGSYGKEEIIDEYIKIGGKYHEHVKDRVLETGIYSAFLNLVSDEKSKKEAERKRRDFLKTKGRNLEDVLRDTVEAKKKERLEKMKTKAKERLASLESDAFKKIEFEQKSHDLKKDLEDKLPEIKKLPERKITSYKSKR